MQRLARVALMVGAIGSLALMFIHGRPSVFLLILFTGWVLAPFIGLAWADRLATGWPASSRATLYYLMLLVSVASLAAYGYDVASGYGRAVWLVATPMGAWVLILIVLPIAVLAGRRAERSNLR